MAKFEMTPIFKALSGSRAYGTHLPTSDYDVRGIFMQPVRQYVGWTQTCEQIQSKDPDTDTETTLFDLRKFMRLATDCNPNIIELLYMPEDCVLETTPQMQLLIDNRHLFLSRKARFTFSGYAHAQIKRMQSHRGYLLHTPHEPTREEFGLPPGDNVKLSVEAINMMRHHAEHLNIPETLLERLTNEAKYMSARRDWKQFLEHEKNRNKSRRDIELLCGYDGKMGAHLVRLLRMCKEILSTGEVLVRRPDADYLRSIRSGEVSYEELLAEAETLDNECEELYEKSELQKSPRPAKIEALFLQLMGI